MLPDFWECVAILITASAFVLDIFSYRRDSKPRPADDQRTRVVVRERVREVRIGRWIVWRSHERDEDIDRS